MTTPIDVRCTACLAPPGAACRSAALGEAIEPHDVRIADARIRDRAAAAAPLIDFDALDEDPDPPNEYVLRALRARADAFGLTVRITPAEHAPDRAIYPLRLELADPRDGRRTIAGYTARDAATCGTGLRTLLSVLP